MRSHYGTLGISNDASARDVTTAYRRLRSALIERGYNNDTVEVTKLDAAYQVLSDPVKRRAHDRWLLLQERQPGSSKPYAADNSAASPVSPSLSAGTSSVSGLDSSLTKSNSNWWIALGILFVIGAVWLGIALDSSDRPTIDPTNLAADPLVNDVAQPGDTLGAPQPWSAYVSTTKANMREAASARAAVVSQLAQWTEVSVVGQEGRWSRIRAIVDGNIYDGYIATNLITAGTARDARFAYCDVAGSGRPYSGEVLQQRGTGGHKITVTAGASDALVKLRSAGQTDLAFYVRAHEQGTVSNLADGHYQVMFATGNEFSRSCLEFMTDMSVIADPTLATFQTARESTWEGEMVYSSSASYELTQSIGGNFKPATIDAASFIE